MQVTVFGASGKVGRLVVDRLLADGYKVAAFVHSSSFEPRAGLTVVKGDVHNSKDIQAALADSEAVVSALGSWGTKTKDILSEGMKQIIPAMQKAGITRIISLTGAGAFAPNDTPSSFDRLSHAMFKLVASKIMADSETHLKLLAQSGLDWTVIRSPVMNNSAKGGYQLTDKACMPWEVVPRAAVAQAMVDQIKNQDFVCAAPFIRR